MVAVIVVAALAFLALVTQAGVLWVQRAHPAPGTMVGVAGANLHVVELGPRDAAGPPIVMLHGASSNLEAMRRPLGDGLAKNHRVILIDRPGHGWSTRVRLEDSTPEIQGRMIAEALAKLGIGKAILVVHSWAGALGARIALDDPERVAGIADREQRVLAMVDRVVRKDQDLAEAVRIPADARCGRHCEQRQKCRKCDRGRREACTHALTPVRLRSLRFGTFLLMAGAPARGLKTRRRKSRAG